MELSGRRVVRGRRAEEGVWKSGGALWDALESVDRSGMGRPSGVEEFTVAKE